MKATLEFNDDDELRDAINGWKWKNVAWKLDQEMRGIIKHGYIGNQEATDGEISMAEYLRSKLRELMSDDGLNLEP